MQKTGKPTVCSHSFHLCASIHSCFISSNKFFNSLVHQYLTHCNTDNEKGDQGLNYTYWDQSTLLSVFWSCFRMLALSSVPDSFFSSFLLYMYQSRRKQKQQHQNSFVYLKMSNIITSFWVGTLEMQSLSLSLSLTYLYPLSQRLCFIHGIHLPVTAWKLSAVTQRYGARHSHTVGPKSLE